MSDCDGSNIPEEIVLYCVKYKLMQHLFVMFDLIGEHFEVEGNLSLMLRPYDDGTDRLYVGIDIDMTKTKAERAYGEFLRDWVNEVPWPERDLIKLEYQLEGKV